ncbi:MAG: PTS sugar transporter subunit IIA [Salinisphaeraceae bacterium]|nr:PTS sugar transporter subunit IIA [Salinisphaeraceae bacterium]
MSIANLLSPDRISLRNDIRSKKRALEEISGMLAKGANIDANAIFTSLVNREKLGSTGLGAGVAIPHGRVRGLDESVGAVLRLANGIDFESSDGQPTDLVFGLIVPEDCTEEHLEILRSLAEMFTDDDFTQKLRNSDSDQALFELLDQYQPVTEA